MGKRDGVALRSEQLRLDDIAAYHRDTEAALRFYYSNALSFFESRFIGYTVQEVDREQQDRLLELEVTCSMSLLAKLEASFRVDYLLRCRVRRRDVLTTYFRPIYRKKAQDISLDNILDGWKDTHPEFKTLVGQLRGALHYRHWIAHGRYWEPKLARQYDYVSVYTLALDMLTALPLISPSRA